MLTSVSPLLIALAVACGPTGGSGPTVQWNLDYETIRQAADEDVEWLIAERVTRLMGNDYRPDLVRSLPPGVRAVYATWELEAEVNNGGFDQYFFNTDGALADEAIQGYRLFGSSEFAALVEQAVANRDDSVALDRLDDRFFDLEETAEIGRVAYIRAHPEAF